MSVDEKMTALADAIRAKANKSGKMNIDEMTVYVRGISVGEGDPTVQTEKQVLLSSPTGVIAPDSGFDSMSSVAYDLDVESKNNLKAENIKQGVKILGVTGNCDPDKWCGEYDGSAYMADSIVSYQGNVYRATKDTDNIPGDSTDWELLNIPEVDQWCGEYDGSAYMAKSIVSHNGSIFRAAKDTDNEPGDPVSTDWVKLNEGAWCGEFDGSPYYKGSLVSYNGNVYVSTKDTDNIPGDDSGDWELINDVVTLSPVTPTFNRNGTYYARNDGYDGYVAVVVNVPPETVNLGEKTVTSYAKERVLDAVNDGLDGYSQVHIKYEEDTETVTPTKATQTIKPASGIVLSEVTVLPIPGEYVVPSGTLTNNMNNVILDVKSYEKVKVNVPIKGNKIITANGVYDAANDGYEGFATVEVDVAANPNIVAGLEITPSNETQSYTAESVGADGYAKVTVLPIPAEYIDSWCGEYDGSAYTANSIVSYQGNVYRAKVDTDEYPTYTAHWEMLNTAEDISTELAAQSELISRIKTALANKAAGGGSSGGLSESELIDFIEGDIAGEFVIPYGTTKLGAYTFQAKSKLTGIIIPDTVTQIATQCIYQCAALKSVIIPDSVNSISAYTVASCNTLESITVGANITSIPNYAFAGNPLLKTVILRSTTIPKLNGTQTFQNCYHILGTTNNTYNPTGAKDGYIYVAAALVDSIKTATYWNAYASQFRALEDYTVDGTITGALDPNKI